VPYIAGSCSQHYTRSVSCHVNLACTVPCVLGNCSMHYSTSSIPGVVHPRHSYIHVHHIPGVPAHVVQRGNNRKACVFSDDDYQYYLEVLCSISCGCKKWGQSTVKFLQVSPRNSSRIIRYSLILLCKLWSTRFACSGRFVSNISEYCSLVIIICSRVLQSITWANFKKYPS